jgi:pantoate--beta-alanine ligase
MIDQLKLTVKLHVVKTKRDKNGLALSSRNARLTDEGRKKATTIYRTMIYIKKNIDLKPIQDLEQYGMKRLAKAGFNPEYVTIVNGYDLQKVKTLTTSDYIVVCVAAWLEGIRLIDNFVLKTKS